MSQKGYVAYAFNRILYSLLSYNLFTTIERYVTSKTKVTYNSELNGCLYYYNHLLFIYHLKLQNK